MVDLRVLEKLGITPEGLKSRFAAEPQNRTGTNEEKEKVQKLIDRMRSRVDGGITYNLQNWQWIYALDKAWDTPFHNFHPRLIEDILSRGCDDDGVKSVIKSLGLSSLVEEYKDADGKTCRRVNYERFQILVHLVKAYTTMRWAKIVNDRRLIPFLKYDPVKLTEANRVKCEVLTDRVQVMSVQMGYFEEMKQAVLKMLQYSYAIQFITEEWFTEEQVRHATADDVRSGKKKYAAGKVTEEYCNEGDEILVKEKEGLRYKTPHISRVYRDMAYPLHTINTDTGINFMGYWEVARYRDVKACDFWNSDKIMLGKASIIDQYPLFFQTVYSACTLTIPVLGNSAVSPAGAANDREKQVAQSWYSNDGGDQGVVITNHFEKIIPKDNGLGDYPYPVWFRFVLAGDGSTVLYAAPLPSIPAIYYGYDADESRDKNASMVMELLPFQYQFENMLSQIILSCKQNLANFSMVDTDVLETGQVSKLANIGNALWAKLNIFEFSGKKQIKAQNKISDVIQSHTLPKHNVAEMVNVLNTILNVMERMIGASAQEVAQAASHELRAEEVRNMAASTSTRVVFTSTPVDLARDAWKRQIYAYLMSNGDDDFYAHIPSEIEITKDRLDKLGFTYVDDDATPSDKQRKVRTTKKAIAMPLYEFAATRDGDDRQNDAQIATVMATFARDLLSNPMTAQAIGPDQALDMANKIARFAGLPEVRLRNVGQQQAQEQLAQVIDVVLQQVDQRVAKAITPLLDATKQNSQDIEKLTMAVAPMLQPNAASNPNPNFAG